MKKLLVILGIVILACLIFFLSIKKSATKVEQTKALKVTASFYPHYFFASQIGQEHVQVVNLTPVGNEPHDYELSPKDIQNIEESDLLILNGGGVESWSIKVRESLKSEKVEVVIVGESFMSKTINEDENEVKDPHIWLDPVLAKQEIILILESFKKMDPKNSLYYEKNAQTLMGKMDDLDRDYNSHLASCKQSTIVTSHAAFGYLANRYGFTQVFISGLSPEEEPSSKTLAKVSNYVKENKIKYIFFESLVSPKLSQTLAHEANIGVLELNPLEGLMQEDVSSGKDYFSVQRENLKNITKALECI